MSEIQDKRLFLLDAMALIYRAYFALIRVPLINSKGLNVSAISGFTNTLYDLVNREKPTHIAVVFDTFEPTTRATEFEFYKANRQETPGDIVTSLPYIRDIISGFRIPIMEVDGYEADDVIGTLSCLGEKAGYEVFMVTPDKDFGQLVSEKVFIYKPPYQGKGNFEKLGVPEVLARWDIKDVKQVIDILGLMGDAVDNIPGIPGVGEKTAIKLLKDFGSIENILQNTDKLTGKLKEKIEQGSEKAIISKKLATIICDAPVELNEEDLLMKEPDREKLAAIFNELEFRTLAKRVLGEEFLAARRDEQVQMDLFGGRVKKESATLVSDEEEEEEEESAPVNHRTLATTPHNYSLVNTPEKIKDVIEEMGAVKEFCFDTETTGLDPLSAELIGMSFSCKSCEAYYISFPADQEKTREMLEPFKDMFANEKILKIGQNIKYDMHILRRYGIEVKGPFFDTMLAHFLIEPDMRHGMDLLSESYLGYRPIPIEDLIGKKGKGQGNMRDVPVEQVVDYAAEDADVTNQLKQHFHPMLKEKNLEKLFYEVEMPVMDVLSDMEFAGVKIDTQFLAKYSEELKQQSEELQKEIFKLSGVKFNLDSPKQLGEVLFVKMQIPYKGKKTKTGQWSTNEEVLSSLAGEHEICQYLMNYRELVKLKSTYVDALPLLVNSRTGRVHTTFNQTIAVTGRLSSVNPNLQNIPIRTDRGKEIRKAFIPRDGDHLILSADYSQIELRIIAALSKDQAMGDAFRKGLDIHAATASKVYGVDLDLVTPEMRRNAKMVNFGIVYGISAFGLSQRLSIPRSEAAELIKQYFLQYPGVKEYMDNSIQFARTNGYVMTLLGRRRNLSDINSGNATVRGFAERNAINMPVQGSAADMIKIAMIRIQKQMKEKKLSSQMTLQVHDELVFDARKEELDTLKSIVREEMQNAIKLEIPMEVEMGVGNNWLEAH